MAGSNGYLWTSAAGGSWGSGANWIAAQRPSANRVSSSGPLSTFAGHRRSPQTPPSAPLSFLNTAASYTIGTDGYILTCPQINDYGGSHTISDYLNASVGVTINVENVSDTLTINNGVYAGNTVQTAGAGNVAISGGVTASEILNTGAGNVTINGSVATFTHRIPARAI